MPGTVPDGVVHERLEHLITHQSNVGAAGLAARIDKLVDVLIDDEGALGRVSFPLTATVRQ